MNECFFYWLLPCLYAFLACAGFCFIFNVHGPGILLCSLGGALGWLIYLLAEFLSPNIMLRFLLAATAITVYSEIMARVRHCPVTSYLIIALLPLVPGSGIYDAMRFCVAGDTQQFLSALLRTFGIAGCLAVGALLGSSLMRVVFSLSRRTNK
ncbi:MAG: threonine/serine exporter family protein [Oscillospiraceae bacterium]|nr:threonine/serine exporter family protein [Oscillospiraceae bacterium]